MKKLLILVLLSFCFTGYTASYLIVDKDTDEIYTISNQNDTVVPEGKEMIVLKDNMEDLGFSENPTNYFYKDKKFIKNLDKIDAQYQANVIAEEIKAEKKMVEDKLKDYAISELEKEGKILKHIK